MFDGCRQSSSVEVDTRSESTTSSEGAARTLLMHSPVELKRGWRRQKRHLFLFSDLLLMSNTKYVYVLSSWSRNYVAINPSHKKMDTFFLFANVLILPSSSRCLWRSCFVPWPPPPAENIIGNVTGSVSLAWDLQTNDKNKRGNYGLRLVLLIEGRWGVWRRWERIREG